MKRCVYFVNKSTCTCSGCSLVIRSPKTHINSSHQIRGGRKNFFFFIYTSYRLSPCACRAIPKHILFIYGYHYKKQYVLQQSGHLGNWGRGQSQHFCNRTVNSINLENKDMMCTCVLCYFCLLFLFFFPSFFLWKQEWL